MQGDECQEIPSCASHVLQEGQINHYGQTISASSPMTTLQIRFSDRNIPDLEVPIESQEELLQLNNAKLRQLVRNLDPKIHSLTYNRRLRFIYNGRPVVDTASFQAALANFAKLIEELSEEEEEEAPEQMSKTKGKETIPTEQPRHKLYIHCIVGDVLSDAELQQEDALDTQVQQPSTTPAPIGIDRLLSAGFSEAEVAEIRRQFQSIYGPMLNEQNSNDLEDEFETDDEEEEQEEEDVSIGAPSEGPSSLVSGGVDELRQLEERWMESSAADPGNLVVQNSGGLFGLGLAEQGNTENRDMFIGLLIGMLFGVPSLLLAKGEFTVLNYHTQFPMFIGVFVNSIFAIIRLWIW